MSARSVVAALIVGVGVVASACAEDPPPDPTNHDVDDGVACGFLAADVVEDMIGRDLNGLDVLGSSSESQSSCIVAVPEGARLLRVDVDPSGPADPGLADLLATMRQDDVTTLADEIGYSATGTPDVDHDGDDPSWGSASVLHGDWRVYAVLWESEWAGLDDREETAVDLMHTVIDVLELSPEWTHDEPPPAGLEAPGAAG